MSTPSATRPGAAAPIACPRCGTTVASGQDWCLTCGTPARTRLAPAPNWRLPVAIAAVVIALAAVVLVVAFVALTGNSQQTGTTSTVAPVNAPVTPGTPTTPPAAAPTTPPDGTPPGTTTGVDPSVPPPGG